ncbi:MAG: hypothetical protein ACK5ME_10745 [Parahaliea sp.]
MEPQAERAEPAERGYRGNKRHGGDREGPEELMSVVVDRFCAVSEMMTWTTARNDCGSWWSADSQYLTGHCPLPCRLFARWGRYRW